MKVDLNNNWIFNSDFDKLPDGDEVRIPHTVKVTPLNYFSESLYQEVSGYLKYIDVPSDWKGKRLFLNFDGVAHEATVYINGLLAGTHSCGYTAFSVELKGLRYGEDNLLAVSVDSRETRNVPPFGFVIDYMTFGGLYREVWLDVAEQSCIADIFVSLWNYDRNAYILCQGAHHVLFSGGSQGTRQDL